MDQSGHSSMRSRAIFNIDQNASETKPNTVARSASRSLYVLHPMRSGLLLRVTWISGRTSDRPNLLEVKKQLFYKKY